MNQSLVLLVTYNKAIENAKNCLRDGDSIEKVVRCIGLPLEEVQKLADEM